MKNVLPNRHCHFRYQCLRCLRYDLCQHCFFYGLTSRGHRLDHPMREYCFRSSKRDATKAWIRLIMNNIVYVGRRNASHKNAKKRFLPHDPKLDDRPAATASASATSEPAKRRLKVDNGSVGKDEVTTLRHCFSSSPTVKVNKLECFKPANFFFRQG
jgi:Zinc finger, ZZ type